MVTQAQRASYPLYATYAWFGILGLLALLGVYSFSREYLEGHYLTGLSDQTPWGLSVVGFVFFAGISAGATVIGVLVYGFGRAGYRPLHARALLVALVSLAASLLFILAHVGSIPRALLVPWVWGNPASMFMYTSLTYYAYGLLLLAGLYYAMRQARGPVGPRNARTGRFLAIGTAFFALVVFTGADAALFAVVKAREFWNNPLLPPHFVSVALVSGTAVMVLVAVATSWLNRQDTVGRETLAQMGVFLAFFIAATGFMDALDLLIYAYSDEITAGEARHFLARDHLPISILQVAGYVAAFAILVFPRGRTAPWLTVASMAALVGVAAYRYNLTTVGLEMQLFPFQEHTHYAPSLSEVSVTVGIAALAVLAYSLLVRIMPMKEKALP